MYCTAEYCSQLFTLLYCTSKIQSSAPWHDMHDGLKFYKINISSHHPGGCRLIIAPFGDAYEKIGTIQRRLAWPLHKDDTLFQSGRPTGLNIYFSLRS
ncbi:hypothetical protein BJV78DRAFT_1218918 [Lactifluus subvellereus]|nr:hypothetical protein BJV78DRAFT_1218918 [Lactifluus subvellereus]